MAAEIKREVKLEIVHVLFLDIVGYSKALTDQQQQLVDQLNQAVRGSEEFRKAAAADRLIKIPTGDGMALIFYDSPEQPVNCAVEISRALKNSPLPVRMGVHSGPVSAVTDLNDRVNAAGMGINVAQRVMDCGDTGHILLSKRVAEHRIHLQGKSSRCWPGRNSTQGQSCSRRKCAQGGRPRPDHGPVNRCGERQPPLGGPLRSRSKRYFRHSG